MYLDEMVQKHSPPLIWRCQTSPHIVGVGLTLFHTLKKFL